MDQYNRERIQELLKQARRIVVKVGTNLVDSGFQELNTSVLKAIANEIADLMADGRKVLLVSSGAVGSGLRTLGHSRVSKKLEERQAYAAIGQSRLMDFYHALFGERSIAVSQILLTRGDLEDRRRYVNACNTLETLLRWGVIPIINENDTVAVEELKFGDNDTLSAVIANKVGADLLVILTDIAGLYYRMPEGDAPGELAAVVDAIDDRVRRAAGKAGSHFAIGGMRSKVDAADLATQAGALVCIANGREPRVLHRLLSLEMPATWFLPQGERMQGRKRWILGKRQVAGRIRVDAGARTAIVEKARSLLPSGVWEVQGSFPQGALVEVADADGHVFARGLAGYSADELRRVKGKPTSEIRSLFPQRTRYAALHRDDLVVL